MRTRATATGVARPDAPVDPSGEQARLVATALRRYFGGVKAVDGVDIRVPAGEVVGVIGPNGSGKSTTLNMLAGTVRPSAGVVRLGDRDVTYFSPARRVKSGLVRVFQQSRVFGSLTLEENLRVTAGRITRAEVTEFLAIVGLDGRARERADALSYGQQRLLELARGVSLRPSLLLLDEPTAGVHTSVITRISELVVNLQAQGVGLLIVEHNVDFVASVSNRMIGMAEGRVVAEGPPDDVLRDETLIASYYGA